MHKPGFLELQPGFGIEVIQAIRDGSFRHAGKIIQAHDWDEQYYRANSFVTGILCGLWSGFASGALACGMALSMVLFGMYFITADPLKKAEWTVQSAISGAPTMAAYFAFETTAGAFLHLIVLGIGMGAILGLFGGCVGKVISALRVGLRHLDAKGTNRVG